MEVWKSPLSSPWVLWFSKKFPEVFPDFSNFLNFFQIFPVFPECCEPWLFEIRTRWNTYFITKIGYNISLGLFKKVVSSCDANYFEETIQNAYKRWRVCDRRVDKNSEYITHITRKDFNHEFHWSMAQEQTPGNVLRGKCS